MSASVVAARIHELELFNEVTTGTEYTIRGATFTVIGFTDERNDAKANFYHGFALLRRGNGDQLYTMSVRGNRRPWNRNIVTSQKVDNWQELTAKLIS